MAFFRPAEGQTTKATAKAQLDHAPNSATRTLRMLYRETTVGDEGFRVFIQNRLPPASAALTIDGPVPGMYAEAKTPLCTSHQRAPRGSVLSR
ncbi:MAG: hypothetical protein EA376_01735 [Phycisphaeraceae bacterium]|nr:MAG: hypothetical protein EA376_01735 [Phycisphaeraceae bacterium]